MTVRKPVGYSGTPLAKKLGIREGSRVAVVGAPEDYERLLEPLPARVEIVREADSGADLLHLFVTQREILEERLKDFRKSLKPGAAVWVSWPKKAAKFPTTVTEDAIRDVALPLGFVDIKVCAVTEFWSGLKLVVRKALRDPA